RALLLREGLAQSGARHRAPTSVDLEGLDLLAHAVEVQLIREREVEAPDLGHRQAELARELDDVERLRPEAQRRDPLRDGRRQARALELARVVGVAPLAPAGRDTRQL